MLQKFARFINRISNISTLIALILITVSFPVILFPAYGIGDILLLDLYFYYNPDQVYEYLVTLGVKGRSAYTWLALTADLVFPVIYSLALSVALMLTLKKPSSPTSELRYLCLFPFLIVIADWCENLSLAFVTQVFPEPVDRGIIMFASFFTSLKWFLVILTLLMLLMAVIIRTGSDIRAR